MSDKDTKTIHIQNNSMRSDLSQDSESNTDWGFYKFNSLCLSLPNQNFNGLFNFIEKLSK